MKLRILMFLFVFSFFLCEGQDKPSLSDSLAIVSREKADKVLEEFKDEKTAKLLFSISDNNYYVALKKGCGYKEYHITMNKSGKIEEKKLLKTNRNNQKILSEAFNLKEYHRNFITEVPDAKFVSGPPSYFVIKNKENERYGEFNLSSMTLPTVIKKEILIFVIQRLLL